MLVQFCINAGSTSVFAKWKWDKVYAGNVKLVIEYYKQEARWGGAASLKSLLLTMPFPLLIPLHT